MLAIQYYNALRSNQVAVTLIDPGWVATDMGKRAGGEGGMPAEKSVEGIIEQIKKSAYPSSPAFVKFDGSLMPW